MIDLNEILQNSLISLIGVILSVVGTFVAMWVKKLADKAGISLDAQRQAWVDARIQDLILQLEEEAASRMKAGLPRIAGGEKFERVLIAALDKIPGLTREQAEKIILSNLPKVGVGALANQPSVGK